VASPNPGISAAGEAAGRTALNPSAGPAAIGGMLVPGEEEPEAETSDAIEVHTEKPTEVLTEMETRLSSAVSDLTKLANALGALSMAPPREFRTLHDDSAGQNGVAGQNGAAGQPATTMAVADPSAGDGGSSRPVGFGAGSSETGTIGGYAASPGVAVETHRQVASYYRM
jgi:hypothetical protein